MLLQGNVPILCIREKKLSCSQNKKTDNLSFCIVKSIIILKRKTVIIKWKKAKKFVYTKIMYNMNCLKKNIFGLFVMLWIIFVFDWRSFNRTLNYYSVHIFHCELYTQLIFKIIFANNLSWPIGIHIIINFTSVKIQKRKKNDTNCIVQYYKKKKYNLLMKIITIIYFINISNLLVK